MMKLILKTKIISIAFSLALMAQFGFAKESTYGGDFTLTDKDNKKFSLSSLKGKPVFVSFGFTSCPDVCPMTLSILKSIKRKLAENKDKVEFIFISIDPKRDTPEKMKEYVGFFDKSFIGLTGTEKEIAEIAYRYGFEYEERKTDSDLKYLYAHSEFFTLVNQKGEIAATYDIKTPIGVIVKEVNELLQKPMSPVKQ